MLDIETELRKHKFILFCVDHYNPLGVLRSFGEVGIEPFTIILKTGKVFIVNHSKYLKKHIYVKSIEEGYDFLMNTFGDEDLKPFIISCDDKIESFYDNHYDEMKEKFYFFHGKEQGIVNYYMNKENISELGKECGFLIPKAEVLDKGVLPQTLKYPVITKTIASIVGGWKDDVYICETPEELSEAYKSIKAPKLIVEEYIRKKGEFCFDAFCINEGKDVCIPFMEKYIRMPHDSFGCYMDVIPYNGEEMKKKISRILQKVGFTGIFEAEFMVGPDDEVYFLEVNFRNSTWGHIVTYGGVNMPYLWAKSTLAGELRLEGVKRRDTYKAMVETSDLKASVFQEKQVSLMQWFKEMVNCDYLIYYHRDDKMPALWKWYELAKDIVKSRLGI